MQLTRWILHRPHRSYQPEQPQGLPGLDPCAHARRRSRAIKHTRVHCSTLHGVCWASTMDGSDLKTTAPPDDRIGCRRGECSVQVRGFQDVDTSNHLA